MPAFATIDDAVSGTPGRMRYDLRRNPESRHPPLVLIGGMTQTIASWGGQLRPLSQTRTVLAYEARGQGATELALDDVSLPRHADDLAALLDALDLRDPIDLCGFSFGGRVALAFAAIHPDRVRRLVVSGVGCDRDVLGQLIVQGWIATLATGDLDALARVSLPDILGPTWLRRHADMIEPMVTAVVQRNTYAGIKALFQQTLGTADPDHAPAALASRVRAPALVLGGALDRLAPPTEIRTLAERLRARHRIFDDAGHTIAIEVADLWREAVLGFLDSEAR